MDATPSSAAAEMPADFLAQALGHLAQARPLVPMYIHLILSALFPIFTGAHASLSRPSSAGEPTKKAKRAGDDDIEEEEEIEDKVQHMEGLSNSDAIVLPITAGLVLAGLYFLIQRYGADVINLILGWYFSGIGVWSITQLVSDAAVVVVSYIFPAWYGDRNTLWHVQPRLQRTVNQRDGKATSLSRHSPLPGPLGRFALPPRFAHSLWTIRQALKQQYSVNIYIHTLIDFRAKLTITNGLSAVVGVATIVYVNLFAKAWFLTNLQGFAVSYSALQLMSPTSFATGSLILSALFCYDIWAVFFTPLMVTVAKNLDQPIKLVFPRPDEPNKTPGEPPVKSFSMLGLGDIVLPGIMIALALRFDLYMFYLKHQKSVTKGSTSRPQGENDSVRKQPYVSVTGHWGDRFWTYGLPTPSVPSQLRTFPKPYFTASLIGYVVGMLTTLSVMSIFEHAQPALLYLVPGVLLTLWGLALWRGELKEMWEFTEAVNGEQIETTKDDRSASGRSIEHAPRGLFERLWREIWTGDESKGQIEPKSEPRKVEVDGAQTSKGPDLDEKGTNNSSAGLLFSISISRDLKGTSRAKRAFPNT